MASTEYRVEGMRDVRRALRRAGGTELLDALKAEHAYIARVVVQAAAPRTPRRTGRLAATVRGSGTRGLSVVRAGGARTPYAGVVHWGSGNRARPPMNIRPNPWISDAAQATETVWANHYEAALRALIRRIEQGA